MKRLVALILSIQLIFLPVQRAYAFAPVIAGVAYAIDFAAPRVISYLGSEVVLQTIVKGMDAGDAFYSAKSKFSKTWFAKLIRNKALAGSAVAGAVLGTIGYFNRDGYLYKKEDLGKLRLRSRKTLNLSLSNKKAQDSTCFDAFHH